MTIRKVGTFLNDMCVEHELSTTFSVALDANPRKFADHLQIRIAKRHDTANSFWKVAETAQVSAEKSLGWLCVKVTYGFTEGLNLNCIDTTLLSIIRELTEDIKKAQEDLELLDILT